MCWRLTIVCPSCSSGRTRSWPPTQALHSGSVRRLQDHRCAAVLSRRAAGWWARRRWHTCQIIRQTCISTSWWLVILDAQQTVQSKQVSIIKYWLVHICIFKYSSKILFSRRPCVVMVKLRDLPGRYSWPLLAPKSRTVFFECVFQIENT